MDLPTELAKMEIGQEFAQLAMKGSDGRYWHQILGFCVKTT